MKATNNNQLRQGALFTLFTTSYIPLFVIVIAKQLKEGWIYLSWGGWNRDALTCFVIHFGMTAILTAVSIVSIIGMIVLMHNLKTNLKNGQITRITKISNRNSEAIGYIATYIVPFFASDFSSLFECGIFVIVMVLIYTIYINSNMILINPILSLWYSLLEVEYKIVGDSSEEVHDALIITNTKNIKENVNYQMYPIGFKLYYGKERDES